MAAKRTIITDDQLFEAQMRRMKPCFLAEENEFAQCATNAERINFFFNDEQEVAHLSSELSRVLPHASKSNEKAITCRKDGNNLFGAEKYEEALKLYTESISWAEGEEEASFAYGNRSAALIAMGLFQECLTDIERALQSGYPVNMRDKLFTRKEKALEALKDSVPKVKAYEIPQSEKNDKIQSARNCIELKTDEKYGRHIIATRDIKIGEILVVEKPYVVVLQPDRFSKPSCFCYGCLVFCYNPIPCTKCHKRLYCSETCREKDFQTYHKHECLILPFIDQFMYLTDYWLLALKITLVAMNDENNTEPGYRSDRYKEVKELRTHRAECTLEKMYLLSLFSTKLFVLLREKSTLFEEISGREEIFKELYFCNLLMSKINCIGMEDWYSHSKYESPMYGTGLFPLFSMFNHSCYPNTTWTYCGSTMIIRAYSPIKKGEQCFISYGITFSEHDLKYRQERLQSLFKFTCTCKACKENWPVLTSREMDWTFNEESITKLKENIEELTDKQAIPPSEETLRLRYIVRKIFAALDEKGQLGCDPTIK